MRRLAGLHIPWHAGWRQSAGEAAMRAPPPLPSPRRRSMVLWELLTWRLPWDTAPLAWQARACAGGGRGICQQQCSCMLLRARGGRPAWPLMRPDLPARTCWQIAASVVGGGRPEVPAADMLPGPDTEQVGCGAAGCRVGHAHEPHHTALAAVGTDGSPLAAAAVRPACLPARLQFAASGGLGGYVALMAACWAQAPAERPSFADLIPQLRRGARSRLVAASQTPVLTAGLHSAAGACRAGRTSRPPLCTRPCAGAWRTSGPRTPGVRACPPPARLAPPCASATSAWRRRRSSWSW